MTREQIGVAMSGGVDSSVTAALLKRQGYDVHGFFMQLPAAAPSDEQVDRVRTLAERLQVPLRIIDMRAPFAAEVIGSFVRTYLAGSTPNPCVVCNELVKFGHLWRAMRDLGMAKMATGHYARIALTSNGTPVLARGLDPGKDQSYFLCRLAPETLAHLVLPLGERTKEEVYRLAAAMDLRGVHGPESQDVCFLAGTSVAAFIAAQGVPEQPGAIVAADGRVLGRHRGLWHYTVGQRRGLDLPDATPWYVRELDARGNRLVVCKGEELWTSRASLVDVRWCGAEPVLPWHGLAQIRGRHAATPAELACAGRGRWRLSFAAPQRAVTPGQFAVFYENDVVRGSGIITAADDNDQDPAK